MTWVDFMAARQYLVEERIGVPQRASVREEEAQAAQTAALIRKGDPSGSG